MRHHRLMRRVRLVAVERLARFELGVQHEVRRFSAVEKIDPDLDAQQARDHALQRLEPFFDLSQRLLPLLRRHLLHLPEHDVFDHGRYRSVRSL